MKIGTKKALITKLLTSNYYARDFDNILIAEIWKEDIKNNYIMDISDMSALDLLCIMSADELISPESVRRTRQKIQEETPSLRGTKYKLRHKAQEEVKQEIKDWTNN